MAVKIPDSVDEMQLVLVNEVKVYEALIKATRSLVTHLYELSPVKTYRNDDSAYTSYRRRVFECCQSVFRAYGAVYSDRTSQLVVSLYRHYFHEVMGREFMVADLDKLIAITPAYARKHLTETNVESDKELKVGDSVLILDDSGTDYWVSGMDKYIGTVQTVEEINRDGTYIYTAGWFFGINAVVKTTSESITYKETSTMDAPIAKESASRPDYPAIETKTFVFGREAKNVSDDEIFRHIAALEAEIAQLNKIENKPKKLVARIKKLQDDIKALIEFSDSRE